MQKSIQKLSVRRFKAGDEPALFQIYHSAIHLAAIANYTKEQVTAWAPDHLDPLLWSNRMQGIDPFVVELGSQLVGYADVQATGYIDHFFVSGHHQRLGVGKMLMERIHSEAHAQNIPVLTSHVSLTAEPFYLHFGFEVVERLNPLVRGVVLPNALLKKILPACPDNQA